MKLKLKEPLRLLHNEGMVVTPNMIHAGLTKVMPDKVVSAGRVRKRAKKPPKP